jgi:O-antigen ligase
MFAIVYVWQGGSVMQSRANTIVDYKTEGSAASRLQAWSAAGTMMANHPITGVGLASFTLGFRHYSTDKPRMAHNTFFQISGESGVIAGCSWLFIIIIALLGLWRGPPEQQPLSGDVDDDDRFASLMGDATLVAIAGFTVCAAFLSLSMLEVFFFLGIVANYLLHRHAHPSVDRPSVQTPKTATRAVRVAVVRSDT